MLINSDETTATWQHRLNLASSIITLPAEALERDELRFIGATCTGAAARLLGVISRDNLQQAIEQELAQLGDAVIEQNLSRAGLAYDSMQGPSRLRTNSSRSQRRRTIANRPGSNYRLMTRASRHRTFMPQPIA